ncbi:MAG: rhomboid family intramembrane serine protease [Bacteroidales bacterium]|jgi:membrane associated rhomboid family serine protease|nr:rhomboid family intramembrane serine protease [Bacteroidales bacterium]NPV36449.1 rhomboid family intramembrane serine protease [Bacteroidales bacterium]
MTNGYYRPSGFGGLTPVVKNLLIINALFFIGTFSIISFTRGQFDPTEWLALYYPASDKFRTWQLVTYMFMHANFAHIFFNMFALWMFGNILEQVWGPKRFLTYYMVTGIGAALVHILVMYYQFWTLDAEISKFILKPNPVDFEVIIGNNFEGLYNPLWLNEFINTWSLAPSDNGLAHEAIQALGKLVTTKMDIPTVGASGAVFGILLAYGMLFPNTLLYIYFLFPIKAKWFVIIYGALEFYFGISGHGDNVAHFAHLGGMIFGYLLIRRWRSRMYY